MTPVDLGFASQWQIGYYGRKIYHKVHYDAISEGQRDLGTAATRRSGYQAGYADFQTAIQAVGVDYDCGIGSLGDLWMRHV